MKEIQTHAQLELIPGPSCVYGKANHQGHAKGYQALMDGPGITDPWSIGRVIPVKPWCTGKQLPLGFNPMDLGSVTPQLATGLRKL